MEKKYSVPPICWLKVTDYMHGWLQHELGCEAWIRKQRVVCVQHLPGARKVLRMETVEDMMEKQPVGNAMSSRRKNCLCAGMVLDADVIAREWGMTKELMALFVPIECPKMCLTKYGVLRPWTLDICFGKKQTIALQDLLRNEFWKAVKEYDEEYARRMNGEYYPARMMVEDFCADTETPDMYVDAIRREWQRRLQRAKNACRPPETVQPV